MLLCQKTLCLVREWHRNLRFIATAAGKVNTEALHRRNKNKKKKPDASYLERKERKILRDRFLKASQETSSSHVYSKLYPWKSPQELAEHLISSEVYNNDGFIALNKPYGIAMARADSSEATGTRTIVETVNSGASLAHTPAMSQVLPLLKTHYAEKHLEIVKSTERWSSGLMLLSTSSKMTEKVQKCLRRSKYKNLPAMTYRLVTLGLPKPVSVNTKVATKLEYVNNVGSVPVITKEYSVNDVRSKKVKPVIVTHKALSYNKETDTSLVEIKAQVFKWHFLRVWLAYCYSPILGDHLYSGRVKALMGRKVLVSPHNVSLEPQKLPDSLYSVLALPARSSEVIPCHMHLSEVSLCQFGEDKSDLVLTAAPPEHFTWTCNQFGLFSGEEEGNHGNVTSQ